MQLKQVKENWLKNQHANHKVSQVLHRKEESIWVLQHLTITIDFTWQAFRYFANGQLQKMSEDRGVGISLSEGIPLSWTLVLFLHITKLQSVKLRNL